MDVALLIVENKKLLRQLEDAKRALWHIVRSCPNSTIAIPYSIQQLTPGRIVKHADEANMCVRLTAIDEGR